MAKKSKRVKTKITTRIARPKPKAKSSAKAKARKLLARIGTKAKAAARRTLRKVRSSESTMASDLARNKKLVLEFYKKLIGEKDYEGARRYMGAEYRQHAPYAADGHAGVAEWVRKFKEAFPQHHYEVKKIIAEGDLVMLHLHGKSGLHPYGEAVVDIFRIENGKVVEHWDIIQPIPQSADNANSMF
ncbi:MAG TPA: ester cyclase [Steroidobacteraceae bacterium]|jgi:predicted SnoaL-like aldol condensation-catalyzing enzyme